MSEATTGRGEFLLACRECGDGLNGRPVLPFGSAAERGRWAAQHREATGHDRWWSTENAVQMAMLIAGGNTATATETIDDVNAVLRRHGFESPLGARGVDSALSLQTARWEAARAQVAAVRALCDELELRDGPGALWANLADEIRQVLGDE